MDLNGKFKNLRCLTTQMRLWGDKPLRGPWKRPAQAAAAWVQEPPAGCRPWAPAGGPGRRWPVEPAEPAEPAVEKQSRGKIRQARVPGVFLSSYLTDNLSTVFALFQLSKSCTGPSFGHSRLKTFWEGISWKPSFWPYPSWITQWSVLINCKMHTELWKSHITFLFVDLPHCNLKILVVPENSPIILKYINDSSMYFLWSM